MFSKPKQEQKVRLEDYDYSLDIASRLFLSDLDHFELEVVQEVLHQSLTFDLENLTDFLGASAGVVIPVLDKIALTKLLTHDGTRVDVCKKMRRHFEFQFERFDETFCPNISYVIRLLNKVPINVLPTWYSISRTSDDIVSSIIEKYLMTPKLFRRHTMNILSKEKLLNAIVDDVYTSIGLKMTAEEVRDRHGLSQEEFEECLLKLEYYFLCFLSYEKRGDRWVEVVTPLDEWRQYLLYQRALTSVETDNVNDPFPILKQIREGLNGNSDELIESLGLTANEERIHWLSLPLEEQAMILYRDVALWSDISSDNKERDIRLVEQCLKRILSKGWVYLDNFVHSIDVPLGNAKPVTLKRKQAGWEYVIPQYDQETLNLIHKVITNYVDIGIVAMGEHNHKKCLCITEFGRQVLGD